MDIFFVFYLTVILNVILAERFDNAYICQYGEFDAIVKHGEHEGEALLFTGNLFTKFDMDDGQPLEQYSVTEVFTGLTGPIKTAVYHTGLKLYYLFQDQRVYGFGGHYKKMKTNVTSRKFFNDNSVMDYVENMDGRITCVLYYCVNSTCTGTVALANGACYECTCHVSLNESKSCLKAEDEIRIPIDIGEKLSPSLCHGMMVANGSKWRVMYTDGETLRYWENDMLMYNKSYNDVFGCISYARRLAYVVFFVTSFVSVIVLIGCVFLFFIPKSRLGRRSELSSHDMSLRKSKTCKQISTSRDKTENIC